jgi:histidyl-tRNA synthetase
MPDLPKTKTKVLVANFSPETVEKSLNLISLLRNSSIASTFYPDSEKLAKQFKYANDLNIPYVAVIGPDEAANFTVTLKNMATGDQKTISQDEIVNYLL